MSEGVFGYVPIHISAYSLLSSIWNFVPGAAAAFPGGQGLLANFTPWVVVTLAL
jgi:hypothetical protein